MPKMKTHKGLRARVRITRTGKVMRRHCGKSHLNSTKTGKRVLQLRRPARVAGRFATTVKRALAH